MENLEKEVISIIEDSKVSEQLVTEILHYGCIAGTVPELLYKKETDSFYERHKEAIIKLMYEFIEQFGLDSPENMFEPGWEQLFGREWLTAEDIAEDSIEEIESIDVFKENSNLLAWFAFEEIVNRVYN